MARSEARLLGEQAQASTPQQHGVRPEFRADTPCLFCSKHWDKRSAEPPSSPARGNKAKGHQHPPPSPAPSPQVPLCKPLCSSTDHATAPSLALSSPVFGPLCNATGFVVAFPSLLLLIWMSLWLRHWFLLPSENQGFPSTLCGVFSLQNLPAAKELTCLTLSCFPTPPQKMLSLTYFPKPPPVQNGSFVSI